LLENVQSDSEVMPEEKSEMRIRDHFRLLQATDNLSLLSCVGFSRPTTLLHPLPLRDGIYTEVGVTPVGERQFRLEPYPFGNRPLVLGFPARHLEGRIFESAEEFQERFAAAPVTQLMVTVS
jgi:hypothetical protein